MTMGYSGDLKPVILAMGTAVVSGAEVTITSGTEICIARVVKPILFVKIGTAVSTGTGIVVTYACRIAELPAVATTTTTATIPLTVVDGIAYGMLAVTSDYSTMRVTKVKNYTSKSISSYVVGVTGLIDY